MSKTLAVILNHNLKFYTDQLYESLKPYENIGGYELTILDNGSTDEQEVSQYTTWRLEENVFFGGAVNTIFDLVLESPEYDSVMILNNDLIVHPYNFVGELRSVMFEQNHAVVSPSIIQPEKTQCFWKQMHNWGSRSPRLVKWVDFMAPLLHRRVVEDIKQYDMNYLMYGWGQDAYTGMRCEDRGETSVVLDNITAIHLSSKTFKDNKISISVEEYCRRAETGMYSFMRDNNLMNRFNEYRKWATNYVY